MTRLFPPPPTPCKGVQDSLGFWIPRCGFWISPGTGFHQSMSGELKFWNLDSLSCMLHPGFQSQGFRISEAKISRIPGIQIPLHESVLSFLM